MNKEKERGRKENPYPNGEIIRNDIRDVRKPLLIIYLLDPKKVRLKCQKDAIHL